MNNMGGGGGGSYIAMKETYSFVWKGMKENQECTIGDDYRDKNLHISMISLMNGP